MSSKNQSIILEDINTKPITTQKTILSALLAIAPDDETYSNELGIRANTYRKWTESQQMTETQKANWKNFSEIRAVYDTMTEDIKPILNHKGDISQIDFMRLQDYVLLALTSGVWIPPRRNADWINMKLRRIDKSKDNYIHKSRFYFNEYKTKRTYGRQDIAIPKGLKKILDVYIKHNPYDYLFVSGTGEKLITPE